MSKRPEPFDPFDDIAFGPPNLPEICGPFRPVRVKDKPSRIVAMTILGPRDYRSFNLGNCRILFVTPHASYVTWRGVWNAVDIEKRTLSPVDRAMVNRARIKEYAREAR